MRVYLIRHGSAVPRDLASRPDGDRFLTREGRARFRKVARRLSALPRMAKVTLLCTSRLVRAVQTAELLATELDFAGPVDVWPELSGEAPCEDLVARLAPLPPASRVAMIGHEPQLSALLGCLVGKRFTQKFPKGAIACLDSDAQIAAGQATFRWMLVPKGRRFVGFSGEDLRAPQSGA